MAFEPTSRNAPNRVNRLADRANYDEEAVYAAVDRAAVCHATFKFPSDDEKPGDDWPVVIPMIFGRKDNTIYLHGHLSSRLLKALSGDDQVKACLAFTTVNGVVVAISSFNSSNNYESAVLLGYTRLVEDDKEKKDALTRITNHTFRNPKTGEEANHWGNTRETTEVEYKSTRVVAFDIEMASAKLRTGPPHDDDKDIENHSQKFWSGVLIKEERFVKAEASPYNQAPFPDYLQKLIS